MSGETSSGSWSIRTERVPRRLSRGDDAIQVAVGSLLSKLGGSIDERCQRGVGKGAAYRDAGDTDRGELGDRWFPGHRENVHGSIDRRHDRADVLDRLEPGHKVDVG